MRIIAGNYKGKRLNPPKDNRVRPTTDRVKEAIFSMVESYVEIEGSIVCDLFAGTGNLGIEAISRGAEMTYFSDTSGDSIGLVKENLGICTGSSRNAKILHGDYTRVLEKLKDEKIKCDVFFVDPPYYLEIQEEAVKKISDIDLLTDEGIIFVEHSKDMKTSEKIGNFTKFKEKKYGIINVTLYKK